MTLPEYKFGNCLLVGGQRWNLSDPPYTVQSSQDLHKVCLSGAGSGETPDFRAELVSSLGRRWKDSVMRWGRFPLPPQPAASSVLEAGRITVGRQAEMGLVYVGEKAPSGVRDISRRTPGSALSHGTWSGGLHSTLSPLRLCL